MSLHDQLMASLALAGRVRRYHTFPVIHQETVGEHSHRVCSLYMQLFGAPRVEVLEYIIYHDLGELSAGDLPFNAKRDVPEMKHFQDRAEEAGLKRLKITMPVLTDDERARVKFCDMLQMLEFARIEMAMGNQFARSVKDNILSALDKFQGLPLEQIKSGILVIMLGTPLESK